MARNKKPQKSARHQYAGKMRHMKLRYEQPEYYYQLQRYARAKRSRESLADGGRKGAAKVIKKYGKEFLLTKLAEYRNLNLTPGEQKVQAILEEIGAVHQTNKIVQNYVVDFLCQDSNGQDCIIEFNGGVHNERLKDPDKEANRLIALVKAGYRVLIITDVELNNGTAGDMIEQFLYPPEYTPDFVDDQPDEPYEPSDPGDFDDDTIPF